MLLSVVLSSAAPPPARWPDCNLILFIFITCLHCGSGQSIYIIFYIYLFNLVFYCMIQFLNNDDSASHFLIMINSINYNYYRSS